MKPAGPIYQMYIGGKEFEPTFESFHFKKIKERDMLKRMCNELWIRHKFYYTNGMLRKKIIKRIRENGEL